MIASGIDDIEFQLDGTITYPENMYINMESHMSQLQEIFLGRVMISNECYLIKKPTDTHGLLGMYYKISPSRRSSITDEEIANTLLGVTLKRDDNRAVIYSTKYNMFSNTKLDDPVEREKCYDFLCDVIGIESGKDSCFSKSNGVVYCHLTSEDPQSEYSNIMYDVQEIISDYQ